MGWQPPLNGPVLVVGPIEPPIGGVSRYCKALAGLLRGTGAVAVQVDPARAIAPDAGFAGRVLRSGAGRVLGHPMLPVLLAVRRQGAALVLDNQQSLWRDPPSRRGHRLCGAVPYVLFVHDGAFPDHVSELGPAGRSSVGRTLLRLSAVVCMSDVIERAVREIAPGARTVRLAPLLRVPGGPPVSWPEALAAFLDRKGPLISASGALHPQYGLEDLLQALEILRGRGVPARLLLLLGSFVEDGGSAARLAEARRRLGEDSILALRDFPDGAAAIGRSQVYVRPSRVDSFGLALHEAMLASVPVVASNHPPRPRGVATYPAGDADALAAAIQKMLEPPARAAAAALVPEQMREVERSRRETLAFLSGLLSAPADSRGPAGPVPAAGR